MTTLYLTLCETSQGQRWWEMSDKPYAVSDRAAHFGPIDCQEDHWSVLDAAHTLANNNQFSLEDEETWPLEE